MPTYQNKEELIKEIDKRAKLFIDEFDEVSEEDKDYMVEGVDRSPSQMISYQLGWLNLLMQWDSDELNNKKVITPADGYKWNNLGGLYEDFYRQYRAYSLNELKDLFKSSVKEFTSWLDTFTNEELFSQDIRKWASSTASRWPIYKWAHINSVAPFKSFRSKIRKWKKLKKSN